MKWFLDQAQHLEICIYMHQDLQSLLQQTTYCIELKTILTYSATFTYYNCKNVDQFLLYACCLSYKPQQEIDYVLIKLIQKDF